MDCPGGSTASLRQQFILTPCRLSWVEFNMLLKTVKVDETALGILPLHKLIYPRKRHTTVPIVSWQLVYPAHFYVHLNPITLTCFKRSFIYYMYNNIFKTASKTMKWNISSNASKIELTLHIHIDSAWITVDTTTQHFKIFISLTSYGFVFLA